MTYNTEGVILHYRDIGEYDRIYSILTRDHGKVDGWAQGIRKPKSKLVSHLQPLYFCDFMFARGRRFDRIAQVRVLNRFPELWSDLQKMAQAVYAAALVDQVLRPGTRERAVCTLLQDALNIISDDGYNAPQPPLTLRGGDANDPPLKVRGGAGGVMSRDNILAIFSLNLLRETGFSPELHNCVICKKPVEGLSRLFDAVRGGVVCRECSAPPLTPPRQGGEIATFPPPAVLRGGVGVFPASSLTLETLETVLASPLAQLEMPDAISRELVQIANAMMAAHFGDPPKAWSFLQGLAREPLYAGAIA